MKVRFNENTILAIVGIVTFMAGIFTVGLKWTLFAMLIIVMVTLFVTSRDKKGKRRKVHHTIKGKVNELKSTGKKLIKGKNGKRLNWFRLFGMIMLGGMALGLALGMMLFAYVAVTAPKFDPKELYTREQTVLFDKEGNTFATLGTEKREKIAYNQLPQVLVDAIVATEDSRFFQHNGFDLPRFVKASLGQAMGNSSAGGASTLDMQIAKNAFTSTDVSIMRKLADIYLSVFKIERKYSKEEIFEFYINTNFLGSNSYGVQQASRTYFGKNASDLTLSEAAIIAGLFQSPSAYNPYSNPEATATRRSTVLALMERHGYITNAERKLADNIPVESLLAVDKNQENSKYQGYIDTVVEEIIAQTDSNPYDVSMKIYTNLDQKKQSYVDDIMNGKTYKWDNDKVQAGATITDINTGAILAVAAGRNRQGERSFNYATMLKRQPGSTAKPLFDYGPGIEYENWSTYTPFVDEPHTYSDGTPVKNWDSKYMGFLTLRRALMFSRNIPALKAFQSNENKNIVEFVKKLGLSPEIDKNGFMHEAHAIGGYNGESPTSLIGAFGAFGNGGYYIKPYSVNKIEYRETGKIVNLKSEKTRAMSEATAYMVTDVLVSTVNGGLSSRQKISGIQVAAKTGTTNFDAATKKQFRIPGGAVNDLWECTYTPDTGICIWYGYPKISNKAYNKSTDGSKRSALLHQIAQGVFEKNGKTFKMPSSVVRISIVPGSNPAVIATGGGGVTELFKKGYEPKATASTKLSNVTSLTGSYDEGTGKVDLSWDHISDMASILETYADVPGIGDLGYEVFMNDGSGYKSLGFTEDNVYSKTVSSSLDSVTFMVKTTFSGSKTIASSGATTVVTINPVGSMSFELNGAANVTKKLSDVPAWWASDGESGINATEDGVPIDSSKLKITRSIAMPTVARAEPYSISYSVTYKGQTFNGVATRSLKVNNN